MKPSTTDCRLLPGQRVNILEMPIQLRSGSNASSGAAPTVFTMDPQNKYRTPKPSLYQAPEVTCQPNSSKVSLTTLTSCFSKLLRRNKPFEENKSEPTSRMCKSSDSLSLRSPLSAGVGSVRAVHSAGEDVHPACTQPPTEFARQPPYATSETTRNVQTSSTATRRDSGLRRGQTLELANAEPSTVPFRSKGLHVPPNTPNELAHNVNQVALSSKDGDKISAHSMYDEILEVHLEGLQADVKSTPLDDTREPPHNGYDSTRSSSVIASDLCSLSFGPSTSCTGSSSPRYCSQPTSPTLGNFSEEASGDYGSPSTQPSPQMEPELEGRDVLGNGLGQGDMNIDPSTQHLRLRNTSKTSQNLCLAVSQTYSLSEAAYESTLTLKPQPSETFDPPGFRSPFHQEDSHVETWNDGSGHRMTGLGGLIDDLGYLCDMIN